MLCLPIHMSFSVVRSGLINIFFGYDILMDICLSIRFMSAFCNLSMRHAFPILYERLKLFYAFFIIAWASVVD